MSSPPPPREASLIRIVAFCRFAEAVAAGMLIPILPIFITELDHPGALLEGATARWPGLFGPLSDEAFGYEQRTAILFSLTGFVMAGIQVFAGRLSDAFDVRKPLILIGIAGGAACSVSYMFLGSFTGLLTTRVLQGLFMGLTFPPLMAIIALHSPRGRGGRTLGMYSTIRMVGFASGPLVGGWVSESWGLGAAFGTSAVLLVVSILAVAIWVPEHKEGPRTTSGPRALPAVAFNLRLLGAALFLMMVGISAMISLFPTYQREFGATKQDLGLVFSVFIVMRVLLQYPFGLLGDRLDKKRVLLAAMVVLVPITALQGHVQSLAELCWLRVLLGAVAAAMSSCIHGIAAERCEAGNRARAMGINTFSFSLGVACGPPLTGFIPDVRIAFAIPAAVTVLLLFAILIWVPSDRQFRLRTAALAPSLS